ncbi:MAG: hypothetical protein KAS93_01520 [Gammaproteobacteria bacterium]|nr:hypothetical protein [Gammaproteobacteria bacterium]
MLKQFFIMIIFTIAGVYFIKEIGIILQSIGHLQILISTHIAKIIPLTNYKLLISNTITLFLVPIVIALIPAFFFWLFAKKDVPRLMHVFWLFWLVSFVVFVLVKI